MVFIAVGDLEPEKILEEIKKRLKPQEKREEIKRIYPTEQKDINKKYEEKEMEVSLPLYMIGIKDDLDGKYQDVVKRHIAIEIILNMLIGKSSKLYSQLYKEGLLIAKPDLDYEFSKEYAHVLIGGQSKDPKEIEKRIKKEIEKMKQEKIDTEYFDRIKKKIYGDYVSEYNNVADIARMFIQDNVKGINSFEYLNQFETVGEKYIKEILNDVFKEDKMVMSVVKSKK